MSRAEFDPDEELDERDRELDEFDEDPCCTFCGGDCIQDAHEDDPINYAPGTMEPCSACLGTGLKKHQVIF